MFVETQRRNMTRITSTIVGITSLLAFVLAFVRVWHRKAMTNKLWILWMAWKRSLWIPELDRLQAYGKAWGIEKETLREKLWKD